MTDSFEIMDAIKEGLELDRFSEWYDNLYNNDADEHEWYDLYLALMEYNGFIPCTHGVQRIYPYAL